MSERWTSLTRVSSPDAEARGRWQELAEEVRRRDRAIDELDRAAEVRAAYAAHGDELYRLALRGLATAAMDVSDGLLLDSWRLAEASGESAMLAVLAPDRGAMVYIDKVESRTALRFAGLPTGDYALALIHDENANARLDTLAGIPREGFGFSRNPPIRFGAPRFAAARFTLTGDAQKQQIRMRYIL